MGEVWKARHRKLDKFVALKLLLAGAENERFLREMQAVGQLDHPNLVKALDAGEQDGTHYLVMELVEGTDLAQVVTEHGPLSPDEVKTMACQIAAGLVYLHGCGFVHRDLKPSNLMRTPDGTIKILDLGLARRLESTPADADLTRSGQAMGTPDYLSPEQASDASHADARADLYGLGATLFYLLTGRAPFADHQGVQAKLKAHLQMEPPAIRSLRPDVPQALADLVNRLLAKKPEDRPISAVSVLAELTSAGARHRRLLIGGAVAVAAAAMVALMLSIGSRPAADATPAPAPQPNPTPAIINDRLRVLQLDVQHFANVMRFGKRFDEPHGVLGRNSFDTRVDDSVTIEATLSRAAYAYLIAFNPDGKEVVCYPENDDEEPEKTDRVRYPSVSRNVDYGLEEGEGMHVFAVVVSNKPLPPYKTWREGRKPSPWKERLQTPPGVVWQDDGKVVEARTALGQDGGVGRGKGQEAQGKSPLVRLTDWLLASPQVEAVMVVGFRVGPKP
jgi:tRNA A-37 threonylcarbamoyl transferase component Bud32